MRELSGLKYDEKAAAGTDLFSKAPLRTAIVKNAAPAMLSMLLVLVYNVADTFFVGQTGDPVQVAAVSLATPVFLLLMAFGTVFGIGGTSVISRALGAGDRATARHASSFCYYASWAVGLASFAVFMLFMPEILKAIGASAQTSGYAGSYLRCVMYSAPFVVIANAFSNIIRAEGRSYAASVGMVAGNLANIILDPIMILGMNMGVFGAAIATVIGNAIGAAYYIGYFLRGKSLLSISPKDFEIKNTMNDILEIGVPASLASVLMSVSSIVLNALVASYGDKQVAAVGIAMKVSMVAGMLPMGFAQGVQALFGYSYGAKDFKRLVALVEHSLVYVTVFAAALSAFCWFCSAPLVGAFISDAEVRTLGVSFVKKLLLSGPFIGVLFVLTSSLQATGAARASLVLSLSRQGFVFLPLLFILNRLLGLNGLLYSQPAADFASIALSIVLFVKVTRRDAIKYKNTSAAKAAEQELSKCPN